jgi:hypothetical protein
MTYPPSQFQLEYGRQAPIWRRRKLIAIVVGIVVIGLGLVLSWRRLSDVYELWCYRREARTWYELGATWVEPPTRLKYTENPADAPDGHFVRSYGRSSAGPFTGFASFGGGKVDRLPLFNGAGKPILAGSPDEVMLFAHLRTNEAGLTRLICVHAPHFHGSKLGIDVAQIGLLNGEYRIIHGNYMQMEMSGMCGPGEIRLYAGQPDPADPSRFSIPFEARGRSGHINGIFKAGETSASDPASARIEMEINANVELTIHLDATTQPSTNPVGQ